MNYYIALKSIGSLVAMLFFASPTFGNAGLAPILKYQGSTNWNVRETNSNCVATAKLVDKDGNQNNGISVSRSGFFGHYGLTIYSAAFSTKTVAMRTEQPNFELSLHTASGQISSKVSMSTNVSMDGNIVPGIGALFATNDSFFLKAGPSLRMSSNQTHIVTLREVPIKEGILLLDECYGSLLKKWFVDPKDVEMIATFPIPKENPGLWLHSSDFPIQQEGSKAPRDNTIVVIKFTVDANGKIEGCQTKVEGSLENMSSIVCNRIQRRARVTPATNLNGQNVAFPIIISVRLQNKESVPEFGE